MTQEQFDLLKDKCDFEQEKLKLENKITLETSDPERLEKLKKELKDLEKSIDEKKITLSNSFNNEMEDTNLVIITFTSKYHKKIFLKNII
jgi:hypothetical protein